VNALVALAHAAHVHHDRAAAWYQSIGDSRAGLRTCAITEIGFVRVAVHTSLQLDVSAARKALAALKASAVVPIELLEDGIGVDRLPAFTRTPSRLTDGHLFELAKKHGAMLATLDEGIPGALLIP
jgi:predicted nucleic acid-binding protein